MKEQPELFDSPPVDPFAGPAPVHRNAHDTEIEAAKRVEPKLGGYRKLAYEAVLAAGERGLCGFELIAMYPTANPYTLRPRLSDLQQEKHGALIVDSGRRRTNGNGSSEIVWVARALAQEET